jgi:hypothetical protein
MADGRAGRNVEKATGMRIASAPRVSLYPQSCAFWGGLVQAFRGRNVTLVDESGESVAPFVVALAVVTVACGGMGGPKKSVPELSSRIKGRAACRGGEFASDLLATALKRRRG